MNFLKIPGLRTEDEFSKEYKELEQMIGNMEERSEAVNMNKKRDQESKKLEAFEVNKSLSNQIHSTNHELEDKILKSIAVIEDLEQTMETLRFNTARMISEYKRAVNSLATRKTEDLIDPKLKDQLFTAKNLFFKKVLREIVVDNDKNEEKIRILENKLMIKDKMLKKALLAAEHFKGSIELVERKYDRIKEKSATFLKRVNESLTFGSVKISDELGNIEIRKLLGHDFRSDKSIRESLNMKDTLLMVEADCFCIYESITSQDASSIINFSEIKEILLLKDEGDSLLYTGMEVLDHNKMGYCFFIRYKNDRGGFIVEIETARVQKWDYIFLIVNLILSNNLPTGNIIKPLTLEATFSKIIKQLTFKTYENITLRRYAPFKFEYPIIEEKDTLENIEDRLLDWEVLEACSQREMSYIGKHNKMRQRDGIGTDTLSKATQTEPVLGQPGQMDSLNMNALSSKEKLIGKKNREIDEFKYIVPTNKNYDNPEELYRIYNRDHYAREELANNQDPEDIPSPEVELDISIDSDDNQETQFFIEDTELASPNGVKPKKRRQNTPHIQKRGEPKEEEAQDEEQLTKYNPFGRGLDTMINFGNKSDLDSLTTEKSYKLSILRILQKGVTAKGSGISGNSGKYILRLLQERDKNMLERLNMNSKVKEGKEVIMISSIIFRFEYKDLKQNQIAGQTTIVISFIDKIEWEFKTPRRNKNSFYSCLINLRLNMKDFID